MSDASEIIKETRKLSDLRETLAKVEEWAASIESLRSILEEEASYVEVSTSNAPGDYLKISLRARFSSYPESITVKDVMSDYEWDQSKLSKKNEGKWDLRLVKKQIY